MTTGVTTMAFAGLAGHNYCRLTTYRADGEAVPTPVWFVRDGDALLICTDDPSGKVRRIRRDGRVAIAPCTLLGKPLGPDEPGRAEVLAGDEARRAQETMHAGYSRGKRLFYRFVHPLVARGKAMVFVRVDAS